MAELLHITERPLWEAARAAGAYEMSTRGRTLEEVGFIHCSQRHQLRAVAEMLYAEWDPEKLVVLVIDGDRVPAPIRYEPPVPGATEEFPHIYGPLPVSAVVAEEPWSWAAARDGDGSADQGV
ncbi:uncharacterized protein (DUF952 family) [Streptomyces sp. Amel2xB2]|uniref:DUF952 domain-containing protein n=1 Tax=Streptomyces sp. Amel2xB2 TaxID=1305829 RepID=UPI000DB94E7F|nr:DUF952 domain-containing protein [Streptomyces sp. Amel2xB2]RAJ65660.1 uncharacterized protein (DUF952 family) [Streptomyces sp. Amel2xB2]